MITVDQISEQISTLTKHAEQVQTEIQQLDSHRVRLSNELTATSGAIQALRALVDGETEEADTIEKSCECAECTCDESAKAESRK